MADPFIELPVVFEIHTARNRYRLTGKRSDVVEVMRERAFMSGSGNVDMMAIEHTDGFLMINLHDIESINVCVPRDDRKEFATSLIAKP